MSSPLLIFLVIALSLTDAAKFPKGWKNCKHDENLNTCLKDALQKVVPFMVQGVPNLGVHSVDPLRFNRLSIGKGQNRPVSLDLDFMDLDVTGVKDVQILSVDNDWKVMKIEAVVPKLLLDGKYKAEGKVLVLPVQGDGDCELELDNFKAHLSIMFGVKSVGTKKYYHIDDMDLKFDSDLMKLRFDNLFNGDKALGDQMNVFINENWRELLNELGPPIAKSLTMAFTEIGNRVFSKIPKDEITPP